jgi:hypothetical protein
MTNNQQIIIDYLKRNGFVRHSDLKHKLNLKGVNSILQIMLKHEMIVKGKKGIYLLANP